MILFLDFDGVLHPDAVYLRVNGEIELRGLGELFMWAPWLIGALADHQDIRIVLSTSWARNLGFHAPVRLRRLRRARGQVGARRAQGPQRDQRAVRALGTGTAPLFRRRTGAGEEG